MFTVGGMFAHADYPADENQHRWPHTFNTSAGELVKVHFFDARSVSNAIIKTECNDGTVGYGENYYTIKDDYLWGSHTNCEHKIRIISHSNSYSEFSFSLVYSIHEATVLQPNSDSNQG
jgi:hypothetical protein